MDRVNDALYTIATQRGQQIEEAVREVWQYQDIAPKRAPSLRVRLAAGLVVLAVQLEPDAVPRASAADAA